MLSQGTTTKQVPIKQFPFAHLKKEMKPRQFDLGYHVNVLGQYSKKMPKREVSANDRSSQNIIGWYDDTRKFNPSYYREH